MKFSRKNTPGVIRRRYSKFGKNYLTGTQKRIFTTITREDFSQFIKRQASRFLHIHIDEFGVKFTKCDSFDVTLGYKDPEYGVFMYREILKYAVAMQRRQKDYITTNSAKNNNRSKTQSYLDSNGNILKRMNKQLQYYFEDKYGK